MMGREMVAYQIAEELKRGNNETDVKMREYEK
jgi:hypothetical protein